MEYMSFHSENNYGATVSNVDTVVPTEGEGEDAYICLDDVAAAFADFLRGTGFSYVEGVTIHKGNGQDVVG